MAWFPFEASLFAIEILLKGGPKCPFFGLNRAILTVVNTFERGGLVP
jgi:hypothetical protein